MILDIICQNHVMETWNVDQNVANSNRELNWIWALNGFSDEIMLCGKYFPLIALRSNQHRNYNKVRQIAKKIKIGSTNKNKKTSIQKNRVQDNFKHSFHPHFITCEFLSSKKWIQKRLYDLVYNAAVIFWYRDFMLS